jgi:hypothetical protein
MTLAATTNKNLVLHATLAPAPAAPKTQSGWDPFEVWRTRVLLPRLAEQRDNAPATPVPAVQLVRS